MSRVQWFWVISTPRAWSMVERLASACSSCDDRSSASKSRTAAGMVRATSWTNTVARCSVSSSNAWGGGAYRLRAMRCPGLTSARMPAAEEKPSRVATAAQAPPGTVRPAPYGAGRPRRGALGHHLQHRQPHRTPGRGRPRTPIPGAITEPPDGTDIRRHLVQASEPVRSLGLAPRDRRDILATWIVIHGPP